MPLKLCRRIFLTAAIICIPLRIILHVFYIDHATGFYDGGNALALLYNAVLMVSVGAMLLIGRRIPMENPVVVPSPFLQVAAFAGGVGMLLLAIPDAARLQGPSYMPYPTWLVWLRFVILTIFPIIGGATLFYVGTKGGKSSVKVSGYLFLLIDVWMAVLLMTCFMEYTASRHVSDQMLVIVVLALGTLVMIPLGRLFAGLTPHRAGQQMISFGLSFSLLVFSVMPGIFLTVKEGAILALTGTESIAMLFMGFFAVAVCFSLKEETAA